MKPGPNLKSLDTAGLREPAEWTAELTEAAEWSQGLHEFDDVPDFDAKEDPEVDVNAHLSRDLSFTRTPTGRMFRDYRADPAAYAHIDPLPKAGQSLHGVISGRYALFELIPAILERTGEKIRDLYIATLSFSKPNAAKLLAMLDAGQVKHIALLISYFFKKQNRSVYDALVPELLERGHRVLALRSHCKLCLIRMDRHGTKYVIESSANLRSSKNIEQFSVTRCPKLYKFHQTWIEDELFRPRKREKADVD